MTTHWLIQVCKCISCHAQQHCLYNAACDAPLQGANVYNQVQATRQDFLIREVRKAAVAVAADGEDDLPDL